MKTIRSFALTIILFCALNFNHSFAQDAVQPHSCGTDLEQTLKDPDQWRAYQQFQKSMEAFRATWKPDPTNDASQKTSDNPNQSKYVIPVIVHVVFADAKDSVGYDQAYSALLTMFNDYRKVPGTRGVGGGASDTKMEFVFASVDPNGKPTNGVKYYRVTPDKTNFKTFGADNEELKMRVAPSWDTKKYFNIWVVRAIEDGDNNPNSQILGYAQFPFSYASGNGKFTDGFVCVNQNFGTTGTSDRYISVTTHELGHCFSLFHTFQGCGTDCKRSGDNICDTPPSSVQFSSPFNRNNSCKEQPYDRPDNPRNYMDYTSPFDAQNHFSLEQVAAVQATLENRDFPHRFGLWQKSNLDAVGAAKNMQPKANFTVSNRNACVGQEIEFSDYTLGMPNKWQWEFSGGEPATATVANPKVKYNTPGVYSVKMKVWNDSPFADSTTKVGYIRVDNANDISFEVTPTKPYLATFNEIGSRDFPPKGWYVVDNDSGYPSAYNWDIIKRVNGYAKTEPEGSGALRFEHYSHSQYNQTDAFVTPIIKLKDMEGKVRLHFDLSYAILSAQDNSRASGISTFYTDTLVVYASGGCDDKWVNIWQKGGLELQTLARTPATNTKGEGGDHSDPKAADWKTISITLKSSFATASQVRFKFGTISGFGNNMYLDNIGVDNDLSAVQDQLSNAKVSFYPNPTDGVTRIECYLQQPATVSYQITDIQGRVILSYPVHSLGQGLHHLDVPLNGLTEGVYVLRMTVNDQYLTKKIVKY